MSDDAIDNILLPFFFSFPWIFPFRFRFGINARYSFFSFFIVLISLRAWGKGFQVGFLASLDTPFPVRGRRLVEGSRPFPSGFLASAQAQLTIVTLSRRISPVAR